MPNLHPDKLVAVTRAIQSRPTKPKPSTEQAAISTVASKPITPKKTSAEGGGNLMEELAFRVRDLHWDGHMNRMARGNKKQPSQGGASAAGPVTISIKPGSNAET